MRAHVFLCMLAYYLEWYMRQRLAPMLFDDTDRDEAEALRSSVVAQAQRSKAAVKKQTTGMTADGLPVHSFRSLLADPRDQPALSADRSDAVEPQFSRGQSTRWGIRCPVAHFKIGVIFSSIGGSKDMEN